MLPNILCWLGSMWFYRGSRPVLLRIPILLWFSGRGVRTPSPLWIRTYWLYTLWWFWNFRPATNESVPFHGSSCHNGQIGGHEFIVLLMVEVFASLESIAIYFAAIDRERLDCIPWVEFQKSWTFEIQILKLSVSLQSVYNFKFKWSIAQRWTENKSEKLLKPA